MEIQLWRELLDPYQLAVDELTVKFHHIIEEHRNQGLYSPIESVDGRVKSIVSILDKMQRKNVSMNDIEKKIEDLAGIRIICQFVEDIDRVVNLIKNRTDMKVKCEKDYVSHMKTSGYRSYHMIILYTVNTIHGPKELSAEIQIRTMAMYFWATSLRLLFISSTSTKSWMASTVICESPLKEMRSVIWCISCRSSPLSVCNMALRMAVAIFSSLNPTTRPSRLSTVCIITFYA